MAGMIAGEAFVRIGAVLGPLQKGLNQAAAQMDAFATRVRRIGLGLTQNAQIIQTEVTARFEQGTGQCGFAGLPRAEQDMDVESRQHTEQRRANIDAIAPG